MLVAVSCRRFPSNKVGRYVLEDVIKAYFIETVLAYGIKGASVVLSHRLSPGVQREAANINEHGDG